MGDRTGSVLFDRIEIFFGVGTAAAQTGGNIYSAVLDNNFSPADPSGYYNDYKSRYVLPMSVSSPVEEYQPAK